MPLSPETGLGPDKNPEIVFPFPAGDRESKEEPMSEYRRDDTASWDAQEVRQAQGARRALCADAQPDGEPVADFDGGAGLIARLNFSLV